MDNGMRTREERLRRLQAGLIDDDQRVGGTSAVRMGRADGSHAGSASGQRAVAVPGRRLPAGASPKHELSDAAAQVIATALKNLLRS